MDALPPIAGTSVRPCCSTALPLLPTDVQLVIFDHVAKEMAHDIRQLARLRSVCRAARRVADGCFADTDTVRIELHEPDRPRTIGTLRQRTLSDHRPYCLLQGTRLPWDRCLDALRLLLTKSRRVRRLFVRIDQHDSTELQVLFDMLLAAPCFEGLRELRIRRRRASLCIPRLAEFIAKHAESLRVIGKLGITDALAISHCQLRLERLSLMSFDLGLETSGEQLQDAFQQLVHAHSITAQHLSFSSFIGLDPQDVVTQEMLESLACSSLRLTMVRGPAVEALPPYMIGKVRSVRQLELGEVVERPHYFNKLVAFEECYRRVFADLDQLTFFQQWDGKSESNDCSKTHHHHHQHTSSPSPRHTLTP